MSNFNENITQGYTHQSPSFLLGGAIHKGQPVQGLPIHLCLKMLNRHGLICGATGTGKTKTVQVFAEQLSNCGVPSLVLDIKGDLSGLAAPGTDHPKIQERHGFIGTPYEPKSFPVELMSLSDEKGLRLRATVSEFGPLLFSKILGLNDTQTSVMTVLFKFSDDNGLALLDLKDVKSVLQYAGDEGNDEIEKLYGNVATNTLSAILRKIVELEQQGGDTFFGEPSFDVYDLLKSEKEQGQVSVLRVTDMQRHPKLFSTFMLCLLAEVYEKFEEQGDSDKPKLVLFIDEAHLLFKEASKELLSQLETVVKLIRSKGVGLFFCTQNPADIPEAVLSQLGTKVQHSLRAFTANDRKEIKQVAQNYPMTDFYDVEEVMTSMGIGEALVTSLNEKGLPTPLVSVLLRAPQSRMDVLSDLEIKGVLSESELVRKYSKTLDRDSAYERLTEKLKDADQDEDSDTPKQSIQKKAEESGWEKWSKNTMVRQIGRTIVREVMRGVLGILGIRPNRRRRRKRYY